MAKKFIPYGSKAKKGEKGEKPAAKSGAPRFGKKSKMRPYA